MSSVFRWDELPGAIVLVTFDVPDNKVNTLSQAVLAELAGIATRLEARGDLRGMLLCSGKPGQFIAGADLHELEQLPHLSPDEAKEKLLEGHRLFDRFAALPFPTVALIDGPCMGGGTELALTFDERIVANSPKTRIGLPEVTIGLIPAWGGTQRLPRCVGLAHAIDVICSGEPVTPQRACAIRLVFDAVPAERLVEEGCRLIELMHASSSPAAPQQPGCFDWRHRRTLRCQPLGLSEDQLAFTIACAEGQIKAKAKGQPTAALTALKAMQQGVNRPLDEGLAIERQIALEVVGSPVSANLIGVFFMNTALGRDRGGVDPVVQPRPVKRAGVIGAGLMGAGIATAYARNGIPTTMIDVSEERLAAGMASARKVIEGRIEIGRATPEDLAQLLTRLGTSTSYCALDGCDVVVEAVPENEALKTQVYGELLPSLRPGAILASNTSTISITRLAQSVPQPERFVGMHFFYPVDRMQLVEVIRGEKTSDETVITIVELARRLRKIPIVCRDCPGFLVNRILLPYMNEAVLLLLEGATMDQIDAVAVKFGFPMGPIALHDLVGLDTAHSAGQVMSAAFRERVVETPLLGQLVQVGRLGKKSGSGFRKFVGKKGTPAADSEAQPFIDRCRIDNRAIAESEMEDRLLFSMLVEATRILEEQIVREPSHVHMGLILGIGFPPHRGGLLKWCDSLGAKSTVERLSQYAPLGKRFEPTDLLNDMARTDGLFHANALRP